MLGLISILGEVAPALDQVAAVGPNSPMAGLVYILCAITSLASAFLLWRAARGSASRLLLWSSLCFVGMAINNVILFISARSPGIDLEVAANAAALGSVLVLLVGLIWDAT